MTSSPTTNDDENPAEAWPCAVAFERPPEESGELPESVSAEPASGAWRVTFCLPSSTSADEIHLVGGFNGWDAHGTAFRRESDGQWRVSVNLGSGVHAYKFVYDGARWERDTSNGDHQPDGLGGENSMLRLGHMGRVEKLEEGVRAGGIQGAACEHDPQQALYRQRAGAETALLRYRSLVGDLEGVDLYQRGVDGVPMEVAAILEPFVYWQVLVPLGDEPVEYAFVLRDGDCVARDPQVFHLDAGELPDFHTPEWAKHATWYQVLVERFRNGDARNDPEFMRPWRSEWYTPSLWEESSDQSFYAEYAFWRLYGGDLAGLRERLDYLQGLGVTALYLNPVFQATTHHKYNATDFRHVDTHYGAGEDYAEAIAEEDMLDPASWTWTPSDRVFLDFVDECHGRGLKVILDGVFNHVGTEHPAFRELEEAGEGSRFADWFEVAGWEPFEHVGWSGLSELPVFAKSEKGFASDGVKQHIFEITRRWMAPDGDVARGVDGWRLDVPMEVAMPFWEEWRILVKSINPEAYIAGEVWDRADSWLDGRRFDGVMNYCLAGSLVAWIGNETHKLLPSEFDRKLAELRLAYPAEATYALMNLVDSHDTDRLVSMFQNPDRGYNRDNREQESEAYDGSKPAELAYRRARLAALFQMTYVGAPMVYYGDEAGMWGSDDPNNRKPMLWQDLEPYEQAGENAVDVQHLAHYQALGQLRREHAALRTGSYRTLLASDELDVFAYLREDEGQQLLVVLNASDEERAPELALLAEEGWTCLYGDGLCVPAVSGCVWMRKR
ncbi:MAG: cyclomaltodextrinase [Planctomycetota bacterium]